MLRIDWAWLKLPLSALDRLGRFCSVGRLPPLWADLVATSGHLLHDQAVIGIEAIGRVVKDIVDRRVLLAPAITSKGAAFPVLTQELGTREFGIKSWCQSLIY